MSLVPYGVVKPVTIRFRRRTKADWLADDPVIAESEPVLERDTGKFKIGDGVSRYSELEYFVSESSVPPPDGSSDAAVLAHINSETPHPVYDDMPSLVLLYENAKV